MSSWRKGPSVAAARSRRRSRSNCSSCNAIFFAAFTSCAWFFADPTGIETLLSLRHAAVVLETAQRVLDLDLAAEFLKRLGEVRSNLEQDLTGRELWAREVEPHRVDATAVAGAFGLELAAGVARQPTRRGAWVVSSGDIEMANGRARGTVIVEHAPTLRRTPVEIEAGCRGAVGAVAHGRVPGEQAWRETTLATAGTDVAARVAAGRLTGTGELDALLALRLLTVGLRSRPAEVDDAPALAGLVAAAAPLGSRELNDVRAALAVLREASGSKITRTALLDLTFLAETVSVQWPGGGECESSPSTH